MAASPPAAPWSYLSYRRQETGFQAGWLFDRLADRFGANELGDDVVEGITSAVRSCDVLLR